MDYIEYSLCPIPFEPWNEILVSALSEVGFESFMEEDLKVKAYISSKEENVLMINAVLEKFNGKNEMSFKWTKETIRHKNWNEVWEANFEPVYVENNLSIVAPFHDESLRKNHVIEIDPKMSFGTGHHQTTFLMCQQIFKLDLKDKCILDMGTGTGVLAILAEQLGARECFAIDIEPWSVENTIYNATRNRCTKIKAIEGGESQIPKILFDCIFANINKNVLKEQLKTYSDSLSLDGTLLLSGFFTSDVQELCVHAEKYNLKTESIHEKESWALIKLRKLISL
jgi:ribosomal protein L11 methyltransferase